MTKLMGEEEGQMRKGGTDWGREQQTVLDGGSDGERCHEEKEGSRCGVSG